MQFIENLFGFSPDNGTGATEAAILFAICAVAAGIFYLAQRVKRAKH